MGTKVLIIGGVAGGASCAARLRRLDESAEIIMFDKGDYISFANCGLPYYIGDTIKNRQDLIIQTPQRFKERFNVDVRIQSEIVSVDPVAKTVTVISKGAKTIEAYDTLVLSPGTVPVRPPIPGIESSFIHTLRTIPDTDKIRSYVDTHHPSSAVVIGGGFIGLEMAENLRLRGLAVTLIEMSNQVFAPADKEMAALLHEHMVTKNIELILNDGVQEFKSVSENSVDIILKSGKSISTNLIILSIGVKADTAFLKGSAIALSERGTIIVDQYLTTNFPDIYAIGDAIEVTDFISGNKVHVPLAGPANRQGRIAADNITGKHSAYKNTQGTAVCKLFDLTAAVTGLSEKNAKQWGIPYLKSYTHGANHASYYPGASVLSIKVLFSPDTGKLLGAQVIGQEGVDKRIDIFATALRQGMTMIELTELELAYAPPYGSAKDPVNIAGFVAQNILEKQMHVFYADETSAIDTNTQVLVDVRTKGEHDMGAIPGSHNIPLDELRHRFEELDRNKEVLVYCQIGLRGYLACRILSQNGFRVKNLSGGYKTWTLGT